MNAYGLNLECNVIGGLLLWPEEFGAQVFARLQENDFEEELLSEIFAAARKAMRGKHDINAAELMARLNGEQKVVAYRCCESVISKSNYLGMVETLAQDSSRRKIKKQVVELAMGEDYDLLPKLRKIVETEAAKANGAKYKDQMAVEAVKFLEEINRPPDPAERIWTGFPKIDQTTGGLRKKTLSYVGARPSTGKTAFALNVLANQIPTKNRCVFFTLEMSTGQLFERLLADRLNIHYGKINSKNLSDKERADMYKALNQIVERDNIRVLDDIYTVEEMEHAIASIKPQLVLVDFIQCVRTVQRFPVRRQEIDYISGEFKRMAKRYNCHIMVLSQISRAGKEAPRMSDLKESGALEQDGDYIFMLHRPYVLLKTDGADPKTAEIMLDKNKYGNTGVIDMWFKGEFQRFTEVRAC